MGKLKFSVCISHLNDYLALYFTVHSIHMDASEDFGSEDFEIVVCDNGSKPVYLEQVNKLFLDRLVWNPWKHRIVHESKQGVDQARMCGAREAKGDYLFFFDSHVLVNRGFFKTAVDYMDKHPEVGILHCGLSWNGYNKRCRGTAYKLKLDTDFWGDWMITNTDKIEPWALASSGLAAFMVRRKEFFDLKGLNSNVIQYGGGEIYIDLKYWMFGYKAMLHPALHVVHSGHSRDYPWDYGTLWVNFGIGAYIIGGEEYLMKKYYASVKKEPTMKRRFAQLCRKARKLGQEERDWLVANAKYTLPEILKKFDELGVYY